MLLAQRGHARFDGPRSFARPHTYFLNRKHLAGVERRAAAHLTNKAQCHEPILWRGHAQPLNQQSIQLCNAYTQCKECIPTASLCRSAFDTRAVSQRVSHAVPLRRLGCYPIDSVSHPSSTCPPRQSSGPIVPRARALAQRSAQNVWPATPSASPSRSPLATTRTRSTLDTETRALHIDPHQSAEILPSLRAPPRRCGPPAC